MEGQCIIQGVRRGWVRIDEHHLDGNHIDDSRIDKFHLDEKFNIMPSLSFFLLMRYTISLLAPEGLFIPSLMMILVYPSIRISSKWVSSNWFSSNWHDTPLVDSAQFSTIEERVNAS